MLQKQSIPINFAQGLDTKTDPKQVQIGKFVSLENSIFTKAGLLQKRNGFSPILSLPTSQSTYLTTFNENLTAVGAPLYALSSGTNQWVQRGSVPAVQTSTLPLIRSATNQSQADTAIAANGLVCTVYTDQTLSDTTMPIYKYAVASSVTGQNIVAPTVISLADSTYGTPRVFLLGNYFIILFTSDVSTVYNLNYIAVSTLNPSVSIGPVVISASYTPSATVSFDAFSFNNSLYIAWNGGGSSGIKIVALSNALLLSATFNPDPSHSATVIGVTADLQNSVIWVSYYNSSTSTGYTFAVNHLLATVLAPTEIITTGTILNITASAQSGINTVFYEVANNYGYDSSIPTHYTASVTITQAGVVGSPVIIARSVGLASKSFIIGGVIYVLTTYQSPFQNTYFLLNGSTSTEANPIVIAKLAYENGGGYLPAGLPEVTVTGDTLQFPYLYKDLIEALSTVGNPQQTTSGGVYSQTGINLAILTLGGAFVSSEIGENLNISGGFLWGYDGYLPVENGFFLWPDSIEVTSSTSGGAITAQEYFYQFTYEWADNQGNVYRSAPSIPVSVTTTGSTSTNTITVPTLRLTYKIPNPAKIVGYRWSAANEVYYQFTSVENPVINDTTVDYVTITDTLADASIIGNNIIYTTGGVVEDINGPATNITTLFDDRLWLVDAEDQNLLWFSKQVIEATPVEMSDLLTVYVAPSIGAQGSTGPITALSAMDDKLIIFKENAIYYINGTGPDNTGANSQYSQPTFIIATVGCANPASIVFTPQGLMFQSDKGIWLLGRDLSTQYIGAPVEAFNTSVVLSSVNVPGENQVRFSINTGEVLMYDYYYGQWGTFVGVPAISSTLYQGLHTFINSLGQAFQESPGSYLDGSNPVLMSFTTSPINLNGLQAYQRAYFFYLLGQYFTPFKLVCSIAYDYVTSPSQVSIINPTNFTPTYGGPEEDGQETVYGQDTPYGGDGNILNWRVFLSKQRCSAFQITIQEVYDASFGVPAGQGFNLSGINLVYAFKKGFRPISAAHSVGG